MFALVLYNDITSAADSYESVKNVRFTDVQTVKKMLSNMSKIRTFGMPLQLERQEKANL